MKKVIPIFAMLIFISCTKKALPVIERRTEEPTAPIVEINVAAGEKLFTTRCARCHELPQPSKYNMERWEPILSTMIPRARLFGNEAANVRAYIKANSAVQ